MRRRRCGARSPTPCCSRSGSCPSSSLKLEPGAAFTFKTQPYPGWDGTVNCRILEIEAHRKLSYTWVVGDMASTPS